MARRESLSNESGSKTTDRATQFCQPLELRRLVNQGSRYRKGGSQEGSVSHEGGYQNSNNPTGPVV